MFTISALYINIRAPYDQTAPLAKPAAVPPSVPECYRLVNLFLDGRNPRTLAAYQADLEDFRRLYVRPNPRQCRPLAA